MNFQGHAIIIGAMKAGTTTLHSLLSQHPQIVAGKRKELNYFRDVERPMVEGYEALFPKLDKRRHAFTLDASPSYSKSRPYISARIALMPGKKRLIYILRDPVDRIDSHMAHIVGKGRWPEDGVPLELFLTVSRYASQLRDFEAFGLTDILLLDFAELCSEPHAVLHRVCAHLGLDFHDPQDTTARNVRQTPSRFVSSAVAAQIRQRLRPEVEALIERYGFEPARGWGIV